jgi:hypothetical protein
MPTLASDTESSGAMSFNNQESKERVLRNVLLTVTATAAILSTPALMPAQAMTPGTVSGIQAALADTGAVHEVAYVCRHRSLSSRRLCWWRPGFRWRWRR